MTVAKKKTASKVVTKKKKALKKSAVPKATKPKSIKTDKQITSLINQSREERIAIWKETEKANELVMKDWGGRLSSTKIKMEKLNKKYEELLLVLLNEAYGVYSEVIKSDLADDFFDALWNQLYKDGIKVQSNTPNASLVIRFICGTSISNKTVSNYAKVLEGADFNNIKSEQFIAWVQQKTMTRVIEDQRNIENNKETRVERMARARAVIMRLIEARETKPLFSWKTTAWQAEKQISTQGLWVGIGNAHRILDGGTNFNASMNLVMMLPFNAEMEKNILNIYARTIVDDVEFYESKMNEMEKKIWADELWEKLVSAGYEESVKQDEYWSNRQQATMYEDQQEFIEKVVKPKKKVKKKKI
jgi:hypothetical protein